MLMNRVVRGATAPKHAAFVRDTSDPRGAQARVFQEILREVEGTPFHGKRVHASARLSDFDVTEYDDYRTAIDRAFASALSPLSGKQVLFWAESAGTSNAPKRFPVTALFQRQFQRTTSPLVHRLCMDHPRFFSAPILYFAATSTGQVSPAGVPIGVISHHDYRTMSPLIRAMYGFPVEVFRDQQTFVDLAPIYAVATDLSAFVALTPGQVQRFAESVVARRAELAAYLEGRRSLPASMPRLRPAEGRRSHAAKVLAGDRFTMKELWPSLAVALTWRAGTCGPQATALAPLLGEGVALRDATYSATEGWMNVPLGDGVGGPIHPGAHVFEFAEPAPKIDRKDLVPLDALEPGKDYEIFLTTAMGLFRYRLHDVVRCTGRFKLTPVVEFLQKAGSQISPGLVQRSLT